MRDTLKQAAGFGARAAAGEELTSDEWAVLEFGRAVTMAKAHDEIERGESVRRVAMGEARRTITTTKYRWPDGSEREPGEEPPEGLVPVERIERVEEIPPDPGAQLKVLAVLYPERWAPVDRSETTIGGTVQHVVVDAHELVASIRNRLEAQTTTAVEKQPAAIEAEACEVVDVPDSEV